MLHPPRESKELSGQRYRVLGLLFLVSTFSFIDRQIIGILATPIKDDLKLSDTQLGLMGGLAFALFYSGLAIPVAWIADRTSRTWTVTIALAAWSGFTAACGLATNFFHLFLARLGVGVGEAGGGPPAYSLICDLFPPSERARAIAAYSFAIPIGSAAAGILGGFLGSALGWRAAFLIVGLAGLILAPIFRVCVREPERGRFDTPKSSKSEASLLGLGRKLGRDSRFWLMSLGAAVASIMGYASFFWIPSLLIRSYDLSLEQAALFDAANLLIGGICGIWIGGVLADRLGARSPAYFAFVPAAALLLAVPCYVVGLLSPSAAVAFVPFSMTTALGFAWIAPAMTLVQHLATPSTRSTASAMFLFVNNLIGIGLGSWLIGALSDALNERFGEEALRYSILSGNTFLLVAAALFALAGLRLARDEPKLA
jgi:predicted MFS family arabinose efflux permease